MYPISQFGRKSGWFCFETIRNRNESGTPVQMEMSPAHKETSVFQ